MKTVRTLQAEDQESHIPTRWSMDPLNPRKAPGDGARSTDQKSGVYRDDRIVHFDGDPEEFADGGENSLRAFKIWTRLSSKISQKARS
jgi:hypothetical protein